ncbi:MAG: NAD(P)/FAD-dependent oxidoreductase [Leptolyngbyaceae cyanobacterium bins.59]|nr:NAD(P)/FAD-dependent oxidoreductase [Leptolyngbyaceae cyanobacterium bins.59]
MQHSPKVIIVGAGFAGLQAAQSLGRSGAEVLLIDQHNYHTFVPLLYQVATAQIEPGQATLPIRTLLRRFAPRSSRAGVRFLRTTVQRVDLKNRIVETEGGPLPYDYLVLATGSKPQFLGVSGVAQHGLLLGSLEDAIVLRSHILKQFEAAAWEPDPQRRQQLLTFTIVGGGATGIEVAGALTELIRGPLKRDYSTLDLRQVQIILLHAGDRLLAELPSSLGDYTRKRLRQIGVEVYLQARVNRVTEDTVYLTNGQKIPTETVIWTAGLDANLLAGTEHLPTATRNRVFVRPTLQVPGYPEVYAIGDTAHIEQQGKPLAGVAPEALQAGVTVARNIQRQMRGRDPQPFQYFNKGRLAIIGCFSGVGKVGPVLLTGFLPWLMWLTVHLVYLPGFRNRLLLLISWLHAYFFNDRSVRLIQPGFSSMGASFQASASQDPPDRKQNFS